MKCQILLSGKKKKKYHCLQMVKINITFVNEITMVVRCEQPLALLTQVMIEKKPKNIGNHFSSQKKCTY